MKKPKKTVTRRRKKNQLPVIPKKLFPIDKDAKQVLKIRYIQGLNESSDSLRKFKEQAKDVVSWVRENRWIEGARWSYESVGPKIDYGKNDVQHKELKRPYLFQFLRDMSPERSVIKNRQSEFTENHINEALWLAFVRPHTRISHIFPTDEMGNAISNEKIGPAILESPGLRKWLKGQGNVHRYMFTNGSLYSIAGALKRAGGRATTRDYLMFDEIDFMPESIFGVYERVMEHSSLKLVRKFSTPTVPLVGIDKVVKDGSENVWFTKCAKCKKEQDFTWPENIINFFEISDYSQDDPNYAKKIDDVYIGCKYCGEYIDRNSEQYVQNSRWIAKKPHLMGIKSSYCVNGMMIAWKTGKELLWKVHQLHGYYHQAMNEIIGLPYMKGDNQLTEADLLTSQRNWKMPVTRTQTMNVCVAGIDWGEHSSWIVIMARGFDPENRDKRCIVFMEEINDDVIARHGLKGHPQAHVEYAAHIINRYRCDLIVNDANGLGIDRNKALLKKFSGRNYGAFFDTAEQGRQLRQSKMIIPHWSDKDWKVTFSKVSMVKEIHTKFRRGDIGLPMIDGDDAPIMRKYVKHLQALATQPRWDESYQREFEIVVKLSTNDHLFDCTMYADIGMDKLIGLTYTTPGVILRRNR